MARVPRVDVGGEIYHVINRANGRFQIFEDDSMYADFEHLLDETKKRFEIDVLAYVLMPNHWHLLLRSKKDGELGRALHWLGTTHSRRVHAFTGTTGGGHLYQGRFKSFLVQGDRHLLTVLKYIERNPVRAKLARRAEGWRWGSAWRRANGSPQQKALLSKLPVPLPRNYRAWVNTPEPSETLNELRRSVNKGAPYGGETWRDSMIRRHGLAQTLRPRGRPKKGD